MKKALKISGFALIITGLSIAVFAAFMFVNNFTLMDELPAEQQYIMAAILCAIFIAIGFLMLKE